MRGETFRRVVQAVPAIVFAIVIVGEGGLVFALGVIAIGIICMHELYRMMRRARPIDLAGFLALAALCLTALYGQRSQLVLVIVLALAVTFLLALVRERRRDVAWGSPRRCWGSSGSASRSPTRYCSASSRTAAGSCSTC